jgi:hypothetical protein
MLSKEIMKGPTLKFIISARYLNINYSESPKAELDPINFYSSEKIISDCGLNSREFVQDRYIFKWYHEDVPMGIYGITTGYQFKIISDPI